MTPAFRRALADWFITTVSLFLGGGLVIFVAVLDLNVSIRDVGPMSAIAYLGLSLDYLWRVLWVGWKEGPR